MVVSHATLTGGISVQMLPTFMKMYIYYTSGNICLTSIVTDELCDRAGDCTYLGTIYLGR
jgi:hypothetical protein